MVKWVNLVREIWLMLVKNQIFIKTDKNRIFIYFKSKDMEKRILIAVFLVKGLFLATNQRFQ